MTELTQRQQQVLDTIRRLITEAQRPPTIRELGIALGISSPNGVFGHLAALKKKGHLKTAWGARGIILAGNGDNTCPVCGR